jgi:hypothetical protein
MKVSDELEAPTALPPETGRTYPLDIKLVGPQSRCGNYGRQKNLLVLPGIELRLTIGIAAELSLIISEK